MNNEFLANNWFSIFTVFCLVGTSCVNYGISKQRIIQTKESVEELKQEMRSDAEQLERNIEHKFNEMTIGIKANADALVAHTANADIHVSSILLELLKTRHEFVAQQLSDARNDIQRIEQQLVKM